MQTRNFLSTACETYWLSVSDPDYSRACHDPAAQAPLVSVILPVHDREASILRAIRSVLTQTYPHVELIVIDDGSTDGTRRLVESLGAQINLISQERRGVYAARNTGLRKAQGELVAFIDSDDAWLPEKLAAQVPLMLRPEVGLVFGDVVHVSSAHDGAPRTGRTSFQVAPPRRGQVAEHFVSSNFVPTSTVLVRRSCLEKIGGFSEMSELSADYVAWFKIALTHDLDYVDRVVAEYTVHPEGISFDLGKALAARIALFETELAHTHEARSRKLLRRLLFNLSVHHALAGLRGRARPAPAALRLAWQTASKVASAAAVPWLAAFAAYQFRVRIRRLF